MPIKWMSVYDTHIKTVDEQHRVLVDMINDLETARANNNEPKLIREIFFKLVDYTKYHFSHEENLMASSNYPKLLEHSSQHKGFINKIVEMLEGLKKGDVNISDKLNEFLMSWLVKHILGYDKEFSNFYNIVARE